MTGVAARTELGRPAVAARRGFTLIELLVVIAVISILASMLMPAVIDAMKQSQKAHCRHNLSQLHHGLALYGGAYECLLPPFGYYYASSASGSPYNSPWWTESVAAWVNTSLKAAERVESIVRCPAWTGARGSHFRGLSCNFGEIFRYYTPSSLGSTIFHGPGSIQVTRITKPSNTLLLLDGGHIFSYSPSIPNWERRNDWDGDLTPDTRDGTACIYGGGAPFRHENSCNVLYADGHVRAMMAREWLASVTEWNPYQ